MVGGAVRGIELHGAAGARLAALRGAFRADLRTGGRGRRAGRGGGEILDAVGLRGEQGRSAGAVPVDQEHCRNTGRG